MTLRVRFALTSALLLAAAPLAAQATPPKAPAKVPAAAPAKPAMDHGAMDHSAHHAQPAKPADDRAASGWAELDAYHQFMMATWHPAKGQNDLAPLRTKAGDMAASAKTLAESAPPKACDTPALRTAAKGLASATADLTTAAANGAADATLKAALSALHDRFETLEAGCKAPGAMHH